MRPSTMSRTVFSVLAIPALWAGIPSPTSAEATTAFENASLANAAKTIEGDLVTVEGRYYLIRESSGKETYLMVTPETEFMGSFRSGDRVQVWMAPIEHAISVRAKVPHEVSANMKTSASTFIGKLVSIEGDHYVLVGSDGNKVRIHINEDTEVSGKFKLGDEIEVVVSPIEHALKISLLP